MLNLVRSATVLLVCPDTFWNMELKNAQWGQHLAHLLLVGSLLQLRELDLDERLQVKGSDSTIRRLCPSFKVVLGAAIASLDHHQLSLLNEAEIFLLQFHLSQSMKTLSWMLKWANVHQTSRHEQGLVTLQIHNSEKWWAVSTSEIYWTEQVMQQRFHNTKVLILLRFWGG